MTLEELKMLMSDGDESTSGVAVHDENAMIIIAWPAWHGRLFPFKPGTRLDIKCEVCGQAVALNPTSQAKINIGGRVACRECFEEATGLSSFGIPDRSSN